MTQLVGCYWCGRLTDLTEPCNADCGAPTCVWDAWGEYTDTTPVVPKFK